MPSNREKRFVASESETDNDEKEEAEMEPEDEAEAGQAKRRLHEEAWAFVDRRTAARKNLTEKTFKHHAPHLAFGA